MPVWQSAPFPNDIPTYPNVLPSTPLPIKQRPVKITHEAVVPSIPAFLRTAGRTIGIGDYQSTGAFTQASLPGIAAGGQLESLLIINTGAGAMTFTGTDGNAVSIAAGAQYAWQVNDGRDVLGSFSANATGTTARVVYTYR